MKKVSSRRTYETQRQDYFVCLGATLGSAVLRRPYWVLGIKPGTLHARQRPYQGTGLFFKLSTVNLFAKDNNNDFCTNILVFFIHVEKHYNKCHHQKNSMVWGPRDSIVGKSPALHATELGINHQHHIWYLSTARRDPRARR